MKILNSKKSISHILNRRVLAVAVVALTTFSWPAIDVLGALSGEVLQVILRIFAFAVVVIAASWSEYLVWREEQEQIGREEQRRKNERAAIVLSRISLLMERKADVLRDNTYGQQVPEQETPYFYNVHSYIREICRELKFTVADIISASSEFVDVSLIYRYEGENDWKWLAGKSGLSASQDLNSFVKKDGTLYYYVLSKENKELVFCNDKQNESAGHYRPGRRDAIFGNQGSYYSTEITCSNNANALVHAILIISTYGVNFVPLDRGEEDVDKFKQVMAHEVVPSFISLLQVEFNALYLRHDFKILSQNNSVPKT